MRLFAAALATATLAAFAQDLPADVARALQPYSEFRTHALAAWHPTQREILVLHRSGNAEMAHRVTEPGARPQALPVTAGVVKAAWQPGRGQVLVFIAPGPDGVPRVQRYDGSTQSAAMVSPAGERAIDFAWSPAGDRIVYSTLEGAHSNLRIVDPRRPETMRRAGRHEGTWTDLAFGANGRRIAAAQLISDAESHLWRIDAATGAARRVTRMEARRPVSYRNPQFSPDGNSLLALCARPAEKRRLVLVPVTGGAERVLTSHLPFDVDAFSASADAGLAALVTNENGAHVMRFIDLVTLKEQPRPPLVEGAIGALAWRPGSREIGFTLSSARTAGDVFSYDAKTNQVTRWTNGNNPAVNTRELPEPKVVRWKAADGRDASALVYPPPARFAGKRPAIVDHRAAAGEVRAGFLGEANYLVNELGMAIVRPDARGAKDIEALLDWIGKQTEMDAARTVVIGDGGASPMDDATFIRAAIDFARRGGQ